MAHRETLIAWLNDAYAMENALVPILQNHARDAEGHPAVRARIEDHVEETRQQAERVKACLGLLGETPSTTKSAFGSLFGMLQAPATGPFKDELVKNAILDFATENFEIACYEALITAAEAVGEQGIIATCRDILREEQQMAQWLHDQLPQTVREYMQRAAMAHAT